MSYFVFLRQLGRIAVPLAVQMTLFTSVAMIDVVMLGQLGDHDVGASGLAERAVFLFLLILFGAGNAGGVLAAQYWGANDGRGLRRVTALATLVTSGIGLLGTLVFSLCSHWVIALGTNDAQVIDHGARYLSIVGLTMFGAGIIVPLEAALRTVDRASVPTRYGVIEAALNFGLNYALIFGNFGMPAMGIEGAAWGTFVARTVRLLLMVLHVRLFEPQVAYTFADLVDSLNWEELRRFWRLATPLIVNHFIWAGGVFTLHLIYGRLGVAELAVATVLSNLQRVVLTLAIATAVASGILVGRAIGASQPSEAMAMAARSARTGAALGLGLALLLGLTQDLALGLFGALDTTTQQLAHSAVWLLMFDIVLRSINVMVIVGALKAGGDVRFCLGMDFTAAWMIGIPLAALGAFEWHVGFLAVYALSMTEETSKFLLSSWRLRRGSWMKKLIGEAPASGVAPVARAAA